MADIKVYWVGNATRFLFEQSGFSATISDSIDVSGVDTAPAGITWDGINTQWTGAQAQRSYKQSGFTGALIDSFDSSGIDTVMVGVTWDGTYQYCVGRTNDDAYKLSGFTATLLDSFSAPQLSPDGCGHDGTDFYYNTDIGVRTYKASGFSVTVKDSMLVGDTNPTGISWTGNDAIFCGWTNDQLLHLSGFSTTVVESVDISGTDGVVNGITWGNFEQRIGTAAISFHYIPNVHIGTPIWEPGNIRVQNPLLFMKERQAISDNVVHPAGSRGDSLRINSGGSESFSLRWAGTISGVVIDAVNGANGPGTGIIRSTGNGTLMSWKAPKSDLFGSTVNCSTDGSFVLEDGEDQMKAIRITVYNSYISSNPIQAQVFLEVNYNNAVASDDITAAEASSGDTEWYNFEMENAGSHDMLAVKAWMTQESADNGIWISTDTQRESDEDDTLWCGRTDDKLYRNSSFSVTLKDSIDVVGVDIDPTGISWDGANTIWCGIQADRIYKNSVFTSSLIDSFDVGAIDTTPAGVSWEGTDTLWCGQQGKKLYKNSTFSVTLIDSIDLTAIGFPDGISWDSNDMLWCSQTTHFLYKNSGFTSSIIDSIDVSGTDNSSGISWDRENTIWIGLGLDNAYKNSAFTSSIIDSFDVGAIDTLPFGIGYMNYANRVDTNWYQPTFEDHADALTWSRIAAAGKENLYCRRIIPASSSADIKKEVQLDWAWDGI